MKTGTELYPNLLNSSHNLTCHKCLQQITYRGNDILCGCEVRPECVRDVRTHSDDGFPLSDMAGRVDVVRDLAAVEVPESNTQDEDTEACKAFDAGLTSLRWFWFVCKLLAVASVGAMVGAWWFHGLGAWVMGGRWH